MVLNKAEYSVQFYSVVYFDSLLVKLANAGLGCFVGYMFCGVLACADDVVLLAPSAGAVRNMLTLCDEFACEFSLKFNAEKIPMSGDTASVISLVVRKFRIWSWWE